MEGRCVRIALEFSEEAGRDESMSSVEAGEERAIEEETKEGGANEETTESSADAGALKEE